MIAVPLSLHWYVGVAPPFKVVAVKVTLVPAQTGLADGAIVMATGNSGFAPVMVMELDVAGVPMAQEVLDVRTLVITSFTAGV